MNDLNNEINRKEVIYIGICTGKRTHFMEIFGFIFLVLEATS